MVLSELPARSHTAQSQPAREGHGWGVQVPEEFPQAGVERNYASGRPLDF